MQNKEMNQRMKEEMNSVRYKMNRYGNPIFFSLILLALLSIAIVGELAENELLCLVPAGIAVFLIAALLVVNAIVEKKELKIELARWAYLFKKDIGFDGDFLETYDPETKNEYVLSQKGVKVILPKKGEQVFVETNDNEFFLPWEDVETVVATDNFARRVRLAVAVIDISKRSVDGGYVPKDSEVHFLPLEEELIGFLQKFGLKERISVEWRYIQVEPKDAFKQILRWGFIRTLKDEKGKRIKREQADHLYED